MSAPIVLTGDTAEFPADCFPGATLVAPVSAPMAGSAKFKVGNLAACIAGDEGKVSMPCQYTTPAFSTPGAGTVTIDSLIPPQNSGVATSSKTAAILATGKFVAKLAVSKPAQLDTPTGPQLDPLTSYTGTGEFKTSNKKATASR
jgi:hypothetical protein